MSLVCHQHADKDATARCVSCGKLLCDECSQSTESRHYCSVCRPAPQRRFSPAIAGLLSLVPGLGQMYSGHPLRSLIWIGSVAFLLQQGIRVGAWPLFAAGWFLNVCDAIALARRSSRPRAAARQSQNALSPDKAFLGLTVAGLGTTFLLQNSVAPTLSVALMWPAALALFGLTLAFSRS